MTVLDDGIPNNVITSGSPEIDKKMGGGIPSGSLTLIEGDSDAGKSVLTQQMAWGALNQGKRVTIYTAENTTRSLLRQMESIGIDVADYYIMQRLQVFAVPVRGISPDDVFTTLVRHIESDNSDVFFIDALTPYVTMSDPQSVLRFMTDCKQECDSGKSVVAVVHTNVIDEGTMVRLRSICDAHLKLRLEEAGDKLIKMMEVAKVRGAGKATGNIVAFNVEPGLGMRIIPVAKAKA